MKRLLVAVALLGCARVGTVIRGSTSIFHASADPPVVTADPVVRGDARLSVLWVGHATTLIELEDRVIATDPVVSSVIGQLSKRLVKPGLDANRMPPLDLVAISHVHFDHLSFGSLDALEQKIDFLVLPHDGLDYLPEYAFDATEVEPWATIEHRGIRVTAVPARHGGWRYGFDAGSRAYGGWVLSRNGTTVYFAGDTGYDAAMFAAIRKQFPAIDLALLPIAPMRPHELIGAWHMNPAEAVRALVDLGAKTLVPIHYDTFINSTDEPGEATAALASAVEAAKLPKERVAVLAIGERRVIVPR